MAKNSLLGVSLLFHGALGVLVYRIDMGHSRAATAIQVAEAKKHEAPKPAPEPPKPPPPAPKHVAKRAAAPAPEKPAEALPPAPAPLAALPDFGLELSSGVGGLAVPPTAAGPSADSAKVAARSLAPAAKRTLTHAATPTDTCDERCVELATVRATHELKRQTRRDLDPDVTGGFYQPVLAWLGEEPVLGGVRLACPLTGASPEITREFNARYHPNTNPAPSVLEVVHADGTSETLSDAAPPVVVAPEEHVSLRLSLPGCAEDDESCGGAENYVVYDALTQTILSRRESLVASWYATDGSLAEPRTEAATADAGSTAQESLTLPARTGRVTVWAVARDDRGGMGWLSGSLNVTP